MCAFLVKARAPSRILCKINPNSRVPSLIDHETNYVIVFKSYAVLQCLVEKNRRLTLWKGTSHLLLLATLSLGVLLVLSNHYIIEHCHHH